MQCKLPHTNTATHSDTHMHAHTSKYTRTRRNFSLQILHRWVKWWLLYTWDGRVEKECFSATTTQLESHYAVVLLPNSKSCRGPGWVSTYPGESLWQRRAMTGWWMEVHRGKWALALQTGWHSAAVRPDHSKCRSKMDGWRLSDGCNPEIFSNMFIC